MKNPKPKLIPFNGYGDLIDYTYQSPGNDYHPDTNRYPDASKEWLKKQEVIWKPEYEFTANMTYIGFERGRSALNFLVTDDNGSQFPLKSSQIDEIMKRAVHGKFSGTFRFVKRGSNYGLEFADVD